MDANLVERAAEGREALVDPLLDVLLRVDREEGEAAEPTLRGLRRAQARLGTFLLSRVDRLRAARIAADTAGDRPERLAAVREERLADQPPQYFELTDRGVNFAHLLPERRARVAEFFAQRDLGPAHRAGSPG